MKNRVIIGITGSLVLIAIINGKVLNLLLSFFLVGVVPGTCFGLQGKNHIRISYAASRENLTEAMKRMAHFVTKYKK